MDGFFYTFTHLLDLLLDLSKEFFHKHFNYFIVFSFKGAYIVSIVVFKGFYVWISDNRGYQMCDSIEYIDRP